HNRGVERPVPSVYYWRTTLTLDSVERAFLAQHGVGRMYVRYFDVVMRDGRPMPNATLQFADTIPDGIEVVPTVFIVENCLRHNLDSVAQLLVDRVVQMNETNDLPPARELQIDCDWTQRSQEVYYAFLRHVRQLLKERGMRLSATIRLHQLAMTPPPVDEGALMVYNTGDATRGGDHNPILDYRDVEPYLRYVADYDLPLCAAYPVFGWQLLFQGSEFKAILRDENLGDTTLFRPLPQGEWLVLQSRDMPLLSDAGNEVARMSVGDHVRVWQPSAQEVQRVADALAARRPTINQQVVFYSLDSKYLNKYNNEFYETLYHL
ncbi:MAG: hypothetical protein IKS64_05485, partial [Muribaculaceae bacterium]|nr:hypothetical protein [Muribaculaceae bacterium]